jgi:hypothetical protein
LSKRTPNARKIAILLAPQLGHGEAAYRIDVGEVVADFIQVTLRELADVRAAIAVFRKARVLAPDLLCTHAHRHREVLDLLAGIVVVELARDRGALPLEQPRERVTERRLAAVTDVQRSGRIRRHELDHHALASTRFAVAETRASGQYGFDHRLPRGRGHEDVDEARDRRSRSSR